MHHCTALCRGIFGSAGLCPRSGLILKCHALSVWRSPEREACLCLPVSTEFVLFQPPPARTRSSSGLGDGQVPGVSRGALHLGERLPLPPALLSGYYQPEALQHDARSVLVLHKRRAGFSIVFLEAGRVIALPLVDHPTDVLARNLTLIAKTIQNLANMSEFGQKEPYMHSMNSFILENRSRMQAFIDAVAVRAILSHLLLCESSFITLGSGRPRWTRRPVTPRPAETCLQLLA